MLADEYDDIESGRDGDSESDGDGNVLDVNTGSLQPVKKTALTERKKQKRISIDSDSETDVNASGKSPNFK